jgi:hypothetical protein
MGRLVSLLDRGPHTLTVTPRTRTKDALGAAVWTPSTPVEARGAMQPVSATESTELGLTTETVYRFLGRTWPGDVHAEVSWNGRPFEQVGEAKVHGMSPRTAHVEVILKARGAAV